MARKKLGYVELEWKCPVCDTRNPGSRRICSGCGSPQPDDVSFEAPAQAELIADKDVAEQAKTGPDVHCPYCDARNPADAKTCKQCGGDLVEAVQREEGDVVGAFETGSAPPIPCPACGSSNAASSTVCGNCGSPLPQSEAPTDKEATPTRRTGTSSGQRSGCVRVAVGLIALVVVALGLYLFFANRTDPSTGTVSGSEWTRSVTIEGLVPVVRTAWRDDIPQGAPIGQCKEEVRNTVEEPVANSREVCGTPYTVDTGTGYGEVVQDCKYQVLDDMCEYEALQWQRVDQITEKGNDLKPIWPAISLGDNQREGGRSETYKCLFVANDETYVYHLSSLEKFSACVPGSRWILQINTFNEIVNADPAQ